MVAMSPSLGGVPLQVTAKHAAREVLPPTQNPGGSPPNLPSVACTPKESVEDLACTCNCTRSPAVPTPPKTVSVQELTVEVHAPVVELEPTVQQYVVDWH
jgi:hypothetical protein